MAVSTTELVLPRLLAERAAAHPERVYVQEVGGGSATYGQVHESALTWAEAFRRLGVQAGDNVLVMLPSCLDAIHAWLGLAWLRAVETGVHNDYRGDMLRYLFENSGARVIVIAARFLDRLGDIADGLPRLEAVVVPDAPSVEGSGPLPVLTRVQFLDGAGAVGDLEPPNEWDTCCMTYTSGTTGKSKGVLVPWAQMHAQTTGTLPPDDLTENDAYYSPFPTFHLSGKMPPFLMALGGSRLVIREQFSGTAFWDDIKAHRCTMTGLVGAMPLFLASQPPRPDDADNPLERVIMLPVIPTFEDFQRRFGVRLRTCYSMTEISVPFTTGWEIGDHRSCGRERGGYPHYEIRIVDAHDVEVPAGEVGELIVRTSVPWTLNAGYFGMPEETARAWRNGWFHTGDAFRRDEAGNYFFVDRIKDAIRRRGENISSFEVEAYVNQHPDVLESAAVAVPSEWGEDEVKVVVVPRPSSELTPEALIRFLIPLMPRFMIPRYVALVDSLPKTEATMRVRKIALREDALNANTWDREAAGIEVPR